MGNHEYCEHCGESSFHLGYPCNPKRLKAFKEKEAEEEARAKIFRERAKAFHKKLQELGIFSYIGRRGEIEIPSSSFTKDFEINFKMLSE